jgi:hypothetical protein
MGPVGGGPGGPRASVDAGLCAGCAHVRVVRSRRGSVFYLCQRSASDPSFPRYPRLPVVVCRGYEPVGSGVRRAVDPA